MKALLWFVLMLSSLAGWARVPPMMQWGEKGIVAGPTKLIPLEMVISTASWSPSGKNLIAIGHQPASAPDLLKPGQTVQQADASAVLAFIDVTTARIATRSLKDVPSWHVEVLGWMPSERAVLVQLDPRKDEEPTWAIVSPAGPIVPLEIPGKPVLVIPHPKREEVIIVTNVEGSETVIGRCSSAGEWQTLTTVRQKTFNAVPMPGRPEEIYLTSTDRPVLEGSRVFDLVKRTLSVPTAKDFELFLDDTNPLEAKSDANAAQFDLAGPLYPCFLRPSYEEESDPSSPAPASEFPARMFLGYTLDDGWVNPQETSVALPVPGGLAVKLLLKYDLKVLREAKIEAERQPAISDAKQAAFAAIMFANANDDFLPDPSVFAAALYPYTKDSNLLARFVVTYTGKVKLDESKDLGKTEMGYVRGPGGRAVVFLDGTARWIADSPAR